MGLFLSVTSIIGAEKSEVISSLSQYVAANRGVFQAEARSTNEDDTLVVATAEGNTSILFPSNDMSWWDTSQALSKILARAAFAFHIHDGDFWMYTLYRNGEQIDAFNPIPDYWSEDPDEQEREANKGDAGKICACVPGVRRQDIEKYLVTWNLEEDNPGKAYSSDEYPYGSEWQMLDFMKKTRLPYPLDEHGQPLGPTYRFSLPTK